MGVFPALVAIGAVSSCGAQCTAMAVASFELVAEASDREETGERTLLDDGSVCATLVGKGDSIEVCQFSSNEAQKTYLVTSPDAFAFSAGMPMSILAHDPTTAKEIATTVQAELSGICQ